MKTLSLTQARNTLLRLAEEIDRDPSVVVEVRKRGRRVLTVMSANLYEALLETLEILEDASLAHRLRRAIREIEAGKGIPWTVARKRLGLDA